MDFLEIEGDLTNQNESEAFITRYDTESENRNGHRWVSEEDYRLLQSYFREVGGEPLLTPNMRQRLRRQKPSLINSYGSPRMVLGLGEKTLPEKPEPPAYIFHLKGYRDSTHS